MYFFSSNLASVGEAATVWKFGGITRDLFILTASYLVMCLLINGIVCVWKEVM